MRLTWRNLYSPCHITRYAPYICHLGTLCLQVIELASVAAKPQQHTPEIILKRSTKFHKHMGGSTYNNMIVQDILWRSPICVESSALDANKQFDSSPHADGIDFCSEPLDQGYG